MSAHTPGPWYVRPSGLAVADKRVWFDEHGARHGETPNMIIIAMTRADARLIAAAPDLLDSNLKFVEAVDALYNITPAWIDDRIYDELPSSGLALAYFAARAAIAKATGGAA